MTSLFGIPVEVSPHIPVETVERFDRPLLARLLSGRTVDVHDESTVLLLDGRPIATEVAHVDGRLTVVMHPDHFAALKVHVEGGE